MKNLLQQLHQLDGKSYKGYKSVQGHYTYDNFTLYIDYVQGDPFAAPSKIRVVVPTQKRSIKNEWLENYHRKIAAADRIARSVGKAVNGSKFQVKGSGKSGAVIFDTPGQEVLERSAVQITSSSITVCLSVGLPANGRRINGREAEKLFGQVIPAIIKNSVFTITDQEIEAAVQLADQQEAIRHEMSKQDWIAFIANGSILPRESGVSNRPLKQAIPFQSPSENEVEISLPHQPGPIKGLAIKKGITLIVGGGYHGKSTVLKAIERGVYPHTKGDGREFVLTNPDAVKIRAEDGRQITGVNISPFISNLPHKQDTQFFTTENASGSTSQAANVMEALEIGATTLLIDEDTSATNFMIRDYRMQQLVKKAQEPITPFIDKVKQMRDQLDVSTILVMGGSGDYFAVADEVIMMDEYVPKNVTNQAQSIMEEYPVERDSATNEYFGKITNRTLKQNSLQTQKGKRAKTQAKGLTKIIMGRSDISFEQTEQLVDASQTRMIAEIIQYLDRTNGLQRPTSLKDLLETIDKQMDQNGLASFAAFQNQHPGDIARPRKYEIAAVLNRIRSLHVLQID
ncbi:ABC-ATPase domain-containing protein [Lentibacillus sp. Marseille-P4043]|uniref:ABC-ATPase domain-containing protein n=1 Tax=Lentibacillus sp. Marseille-P4043 TaxID=2040293 RepID=UPI000D0BB00B|nr:ABC-ATPase domain-containing protein [Lentibacillus sp. Marseille-P4043]